MSIIWLWLARNNVCEGIINIANDSMGGSGFVEGRFRDIVGVAYSGKE